MQKPTKILAAFSLLDCVACGWRLYVLADERGPWDGRCPRCKTGQFRFGGFRVAKKQSDLAVIQFEGTIANLEPPDEHELTRTDGGAGAGGADDARGG